MRYILAHDLGTSGNKATLFSEDGRLIKSEVFSYDAHYFNDTWVEQNADDWWNAVCRTSSSLIQSTGVDPGIGGRPYAKPVVAFWSRFLRATSPRLPSAAR